MVRGEVFRLRAPRGRRGAEQAGERLQVDALLELSTVLVAPTSRSAPPRSFRPSIEIDGQSTRVLVEQTTAVMSDRLGDSAGRLDANELREVDCALGTVFGL